MKRRLFGQDYLDAQERLFKRLPRRHHAAVNEVLDLLQLWDMSVFLGLAKAEAAAQRRGQGEGEKGSR